MTSPRLAYNVPRQGRHYHCLACGNNHPSVTNIIGCIDKPQLLGWAKKMGGLRAISQHQIISNRLDTIIEAGHSIPTDDTELHTLIKQVKKEAKTRPDHPLRGLADVYDLMFFGPDAQRDAAADVGTLVHAVAESLSSDSDLPDFSDVEQPYVDSFLEFITEWDPDFEHVEATVFNCAEGYAGTADFIANIGGLRVVGDYKSGKGVYDDAALQLAALSHAQHIAQDDDATVPLGPVDAALIVHLRPDGYAVYPVDISPKVFAGFCAARKTWNWTTGGDKDGAIGEPLASPAALNKEAAA